jgi:predicted RNase H-related nuclease YkuK (DUF458 family)
MNQLIEAVSFGVFKTGNGAEIHDLLQYVESWCKHHPNGLIYVGSDSKVIGNQVKYATVVCLRDVGKGVHEVYRNIKIPKPKDRFTRLWNEVMYSVEVARGLQEIGPIEVHMDFNSNPKYQSFQLYDAGMGLIQSMGFKGAGKPLSWAATSGANRHCQ